MDIAGADEVGVALQRFGSRYTRRIYTEVELSDCRGEWVRRCQGLAARFAAKEAAIKALAPAVDDGLAWTEIEVRRAYSGYPELRLSGAAAVLAEARGLEGWTLSLTHHGDLAAAVVVGYA